MSQLVLTASREGDLKSLQDALVSTPNLNVRDKRNMTPLHFACVEGHKQIVEFLVAAGAELSPKDDLELTPLFYARKHKHSEIERILVGRGAILNLFEAASLGDKDRVSELLAKHPEDANVPTCSWTPLFVAANSEIAEMLIECGADIEFESDDGYKPIHAAAIGHSDVLALLLSKGADPNTSYHGSTPLHLAAQSGNLESVQLLLRYGAKPDNADAGGYLPKDLASNYPSILNILTEK